MRGAAIALAATLVSACATIEPPVSPADWPAEREALQALGDWTLEGRIAVAAGNEGFSGGFEWRQQGDHAEVTLRRPLGGAPIRLHIEDGRYAVTDERGARHDGEDALRFLERTVGQDVALPVREMRYWLLGAPAPAVPHAETLGEDRRLAILDQNGWTVRYERYQPVGARALPRRIEMTTEGLRLRVVVAGWRLGS